MLTTIQEPEAQTLPNYTDKVVDQNARRWIWSGSIEETLPRGCGHDVLFRRTLTPIDTYASRIPLELPAMWVNADGTEETVENQFGSALLTITERPPAGSGFGAATVRGTGIRMTAAQLTHDIVYSMNTLRERGINEVKCLRGRFEKGSTTEPLSVLEQIEAAVLPAEHRVTLRKTVDWLMSGDVYQAIEAMVPAQFTDLAMQLQAELLELAQLAEFFIANEIDTAENEVAERVAGGKLGQKALTPFNRLCLKELERVEQKHLPAKQGLDQNRLLGKEISTGIQEAVRAALTNSREASVTQQENDELRKRLEEVEKKLKPVARKQQEVV